jgi:hypothetical protein
MTDSKAGRPLTHEELEALRAATDNRRTREMSGAAWQEVLRTQRDVQASLARSSDVRSAAAKIMDKIKACADHARKLRERGCIT